METASIAEKKVYVFPLIAQGARRRLFVEGPATLAAHESLCALAKTLRSASEDGASMRELSQEAVTLLIAQGFTPIWH